MRAAEACAKSARPNINVTPLIDILLVLLIIFMVITPLRPARFRALVPEPPPDSELINKSPRTPAGEDPTPLRPRLLGAQPTVAEGPLANAPPVAARLAEEWRERKSGGNWKAELVTRTDLPPDQRIERTVFVKAPRSVRYGEVAKVIDGIKGAGAQPIGLQTEALEN